MALLSAANLLSAVSMFHLTIAYFFLVSPALISNQNLVFILGAAMDLVRQVIPYLDFWFSLCTLLVARPFLSTNRSCCSVLADRNLFKALSISCFPFRQPCSPRYR